jgi:hypothetical protein
MGYQLYLKLTQAYANQIINRTRETQPPVRPKPAKRKKNTKNPRKSEI